MKVTAVTKYSRPRFPTHEILEQHPEILRIIPRRWRNNPIVLSAITGLTLLVCGAGGRSTVHASAARTVVAPIFEHGAGVVNRPHMPRTQRDLPSRGGFFQSRFRSETRAVTLGVPSPPSETVFLAMSGRLFTEAEARYIINEEIRRVGIVFDVPSTPVKGASIPVIKSAGYLLSRNKAGQVVFDRGAKTQKTKLTLDGTDPKRHISFEFVSDSDYAKWRTRTAQTAGIEDILGAAHIVRNGLKSSSASGYTAVFYDPAIGGREAGNSSDQAKTQDALRAQVRDFIKWLKGQGVI